MRQLETIEAVLNELGGNKGAAVLVGAKPKTVSMWRSANAFPARTFILMNDALRAHGCEAPPSLWGMIEPGEAAE